MSGGVVGYTYADDNLCPSCTVGRMRANGIKVARSSEQDEAISRAAERLGVDYSDERSYDSKDFPKTITSQQARTEMTELPDGGRGEIEDEQCDRCGKWVVLGEKSPTAAGLTRYVRDSYELPHALARDIAGELRKWGLSHPEFIKEENVRQAAAMFPHDYATVHAEGNPQRIELRLTPEYDDDPCFYCEQPWEKHTFTCSTCKTDVPADVPHSHQLPIEGQLRLRAVPEKAAL
ncbi:hypothetical protein ACIQVK_18735 [Streptomyces sp. NPDC090493]|uniref:hypothetical protein n=1 Tax=Streptomyces sp. NPDC090493 TaxID=3365964 RepID=UPI003816FC8D